MREIFQVKIIGSKSERPVSLKNGAMSNRVRAQALQKFEILEIATGQAPKKILAQRAGDDQIIKVIDEVSGEEFDLVIEDFHRANASLWGGNDAGLLQQYQIAGETQLSQLVLGGGASGVGLVSSLPSTLFVGVGALGVAAAAGGSGGGSDKSDVTAPSAPDIHTVAVDNTVNAAEASHSIVVTGSKEAGALIVLTIGGIGTRTLAASAETNWSYTLTAAEIAALGQGQIVLSVTQADAAGNMSVASTRTITIDTVLPAGLELSLATDSGSSDVDDITNVEVVNILGLEAGASWEYKIDDGAWNAGSGSRFDLTEGAHVYSVRQTDVAGNVSVVSARTITLDTVLPASLELRLSRDSGDSNSDGITNVAAVNVLGLGEGDTWEYQVDGGAWEESSSGYFNLTEGTHVYSVRWTDVAGNVSIANTRTLTLDTALPGNLLHSLATDSGGSNVDGLTNVGVVDILNLELGASWEYRVDDGTWMAGNGSGFNLIEGSHTYAVRQTDVAGNVSVIVPAVSYTLDTQPVIANGMRSTLQLEAMNQTQGNDQQPMVTALDAGGAYVVTWFGQDVGGDKSIFLQRFHASGEINGFTIQLEATGKTNGDDDNPKTITVGGNGAFVTVWRGIDAEGDSSIFVQLLNADGSLNGSATKLEAVGKSNGTDDDPKVVALGNSGAYVVVWQGQDTSVGADRSVFVQQFNADGTVRGNTVQLEATGASDGADWFPQVVALGSGGTYVVAWSGQENGGAEFSIYLQQFNANGVPNGVAVKLEALGRTNGNDWEQRVVAIGSDGAYAVTWYAQDTANNYSIFVQRFNADGSLNGATTQLEAIGVTNGADLDPEVVALGDEGAFAVTWAGVDAQGDSSVFVQQFNTDGTSVGRQMVGLEPQGVSNGQDRYPQIASLGNDGAYAVTWFGLDSEGDDSVFVQRFNQNGSLQGDQIKLEATGVINGADSYPKITSLGAEGAFVVTWQGIDSDGDSSVFVQQFNADGSRLQDAIALQLAAGQDKWLTPNEAAATIEVRYLELAEGDVIQLLDAGSAVGSSHTVTASEVSTGFVTLTINKSGLTDVSPGSKEGAHRITAVVTDLAGNVSDETLVGITLTVDSMAQAPVLSLSVDTGGIDGVTNVAKIIVGGLEPRATWQYEIDNNGVWLSGSGSSFNLTNGTHGYRVQQTDAAGNASNPSTSQSFTLDTSPPAAVIFNSITSDNVLNAAEVSGMPTISGSKESGAFVTLTIGSNTYAFLPDNTTTWSYTLTAIDVSALVQGVQTFTATQTDAAGNNSVVSSHSFTVDTVVNTPVWTPNDSGFSNTDGVTNVGTVNVNSNSLESGSIWEYQVDNGAWSTGSGSSFNLSTGAHTYSVRQTDAAGNRSVTSAKSMTLDTVAVDVGVILQNMVQLEPLNKTNGNDDRPQIGAVGNTGNYVVTWTGPNSISNNCIYVQKFNSDGTTTGYPLIELLSPIYFNTPNPQIASLSNDGAYVISWHRQDTNGDDSIYVQRFNANGTTNGVAVMLEPSGVANSSDQYSEVAALGTNGAFVVAWMGVDIDGDNSVCVQQFNADGTTTGRNMARLEPIANGEDGQPQIAAVGSNGAYAVTWIGADGTGTKRVFAQKFNADGTTTGNALTSLDIVLQNGDYAIPQIAAIGTDGAYAVVSTGRDSRTANFGIFVQQFNANGSPNEHALVHLRNLSMHDGGGWQPSIAALGTTGAYVVTWMGVDNEGDASIFVQQFNANGTITGRNVVQLEAANMTTGDDWNPKVKSIGTDGSYVVAWCAEDSAGDLSIFVQRFNADGSTTGHDTIQLEAKNVTNGYDADPKITAIGSNGAFAVTWAGVDSNGDSSVFVQQFNADGTLKQDKVEIEVASGQDRWLNAQEASVTLTLRYAELAEGDVIQLREAGANVGTAHTVTAAEVAAGVASLVLQKSSLAGGGSNGDHPLAAVITDLAGNVSTQTPVALTLRVDTTVPSAPTVNAIAGDDILNYQENLGLVSANGTPVLITGTKEAGASIHLTIDDKTYFLSANAGTSWSYALSNEDTIYWTVNGSITSPAIKSNLNLSVRQTDAAGNTSAAVTHSLRIDTYAAAPNLQLAADNGSSNTDGVTNFATVNVAGLEVGASWKYQIDAGAWQTGTGSSFSLTSGTHVYNVQQTDVAGNTSDTTFSSQTFTLDTVAMVTSAQLSTVQLEAINKTNGADLAPQITKLGGSGQYAVAWYGPDNAGDKSIFVQQFDANGTTTGFTPVQLEAIGKTNGDDISPQITVIDSSGGYVVTWCGVDSASDKSIFVQQFNANGTTTGYAPVQLEAIGVTNGIDEMPQVFAIGGGKYVVAWSGTDGAGDKSIFVQQFNANGNIVGNTRVQLEATDTSVGDDIAPQIATVGSNGQYAVTWMGGDGGDTSIFVQQFNANGTTVGFSPVKIEPVGITNRPDFYPQITALGGDGAYAVVWYGLDDEYFANVYVQRFNANGTAQGTPITIADPRANSTWMENPQIVSVGTQGAFVVVWEALDSNTIPQLWVQRFNPDGTRSSITQLEVYADQYYPSTQPQIASIGSDGAYAVVWRSEDSSRPGTGNSSIFVQQFNADGSTTGLNRVKLDAVGVVNGMDEAPQITAVGNDGGYTVTWSGLDASGDSSVFVQQFNADGTTRKSLVDVQTASGEDKLLSWSETSVTLQVSYSGLSEGQVIEFFESGASLGVTHTVSAADVSAGRASMVVQKDDLGGNRDYQLKAKVMDLAGNVSAESPVAIVLTVDRPASVIGLGAGKGQLINGVQVEGKWFYAWDKNADGNLSSANDLVTLDDLATTFLGAGKSGSDFTAAGRTFAMNGVNLALPTVGIDPLPGSTTQVNGTASSQSGFRSNSTPNSNPTYDDLLAVWDAFNGTGVGQNVQGVPPGWDANLAYWTANAADASHYVANMQGIVDIHAHTNNNFAVFQVL